MGLQIIELFSVPPSVRSNYYVRISVNWQKDFKCFPFLTVQTSLVFAHYSDTVLRDDSGSLLNCHNGIIGYEVIASLRFLAAFRGSVVGVA